MPRSQTGVDRLTTGRGRAGSSLVVPFDQKLVLNQWLLGLFGVTRFQDLAKHLDDEALEGLDENNLHRFHYALTLHVPAEQRPELPDDLLLEYDQNIAGHTLRLNERRLARGESPIVWKYFQYLALLFTEVYLARYFQDPSSLLSVVNDRIGVFNEGKSASDRIAPLDTAEPWQQLNKLALWCATGSGKTLLMHANILQYRFHLEKRGRTRELNRIILLTPNEGLSQQHLREFGIAGIEAELFNKDGGGLFAGRAVEIIDIHKLKDQMGDKTVAVEAFEGNNLVLVDEGHRGASSGEEGAWMRFRNALCESGFSFEYSATFGQAVKAGRGARGNVGLTNLYAKSILFDYSYRYFYNDGFGKDYQIMNLDEATQRQQLELYLTACLLVFFQQQRLYREYEVAFRPFNIERPLWVFVGGSVTKTLASREASDILEILKFLAHFVTDRTGSIQRIGRVLNQGLVTAAATNLFAGRFNYLGSTGLSPSQVFDEVLESLFNAPAGGGLYVENLKDATGEIALRLGADNKPFGVINVGDDAGLVRLCETHGLTVGDREFASSLFYDINSPRSSVNLLIGSKKFTEGWNSWRVSTMGLMNVGATEGAQIIQLFGRGVRLKGYGGSLKRSTGTRLPEGTIRPKYIGALETLSVFGIRANYMAQFRDFLKEEGLPVEERIEFLLPVTKNLRSQKLKTIGLEKTIRGVSTDSGDPFRTLGPMPVLWCPDLGVDPGAAYLQQNQVVLNWYPKVQSLRSGGLTPGEAESSPNEAHLSAKHVAFLDIDRLFLELERFKTERGWHNLSLTRGAVDALLRDQSWYRLLIPSEELAFDSFDRIRVWQDLALALLKKYTERYYMYRRREWELPHLEYRELRDDDLGWPQAEIEPADRYFYRILIEQSREDIVAKLEELKGLIERGELKRWTFDHMRAVSFGQHLYQPLLFADTSSVQISPQPLNSGEMRFVEDLAAFCDGNPGFFSGRELFLLRNQSRGRGVGFFEAGNFFPDFILWIVSGAQQNVIFVDPKGLRNLGGGAHDPKIEFYRTIKDIEERLDDSQTHLESFIVSNTPAHEIGRAWGLEKSELARRHVLFQEEDRGTYIGAMLDQTCDLVIACPGKEPNDDFE